MSTGNWGFRSYAVLEDWGLLGNCIRQPHHSEFILITAGGLLMGVYFRVVGWVNIRTAGSFSMLVLIDIGENAISFSGVDSCVSLQITMGL